MDFCGLALGVSCGDALAESLEAARLGPMRLQALYPVLCFQNARP